MPSCTKFGILRTQQHIQYNALRKHTIQYFDVLLVSEVEPPTGMSIELSVTEKIATIKFDVVPAAIINPNVYNKASLKVTYPDHSTQAGQEIYNSDNRTIVFFLRNAQIGNHLFELSLTANEFASTYLGANKIRGMFFHYAIIPIAIGIISSNVVT